MSSLLMIPPPPRSTLFPYTTLFRSQPCPDSVAHQAGDIVNVDLLHQLRAMGLDRLRAQIEYLRHFFRRSEEHTSELQSHHDLVCRLLLEKKNHQDPTCPTSTKQCRR